MYGDACGEETPKLSSFNLIKVYNKEKFHNALALALGCEQIAKDKRLNISVDDSNELISSCTSLHDIYIVISNSIFFTIRSTITT